MEVTAPGYPLRPEIVESNSLSYHYATVNLRARLDEDSSPRKAAQVRLYESRKKSMAAHYQQMGRTCSETSIKLPDRRSMALKSVVTKEKSRFMQSFLFAETFKYFYSCSRRRDA